VRASLHLISRILLILLTHLLCRYYRERLANCIAKIVTIPAAMQGIVNPVPRVAHPEWLQKRISANDTTSKQTSIASFFSAALPSDPFAALDMEDLAKRTPNTAQKKLPIVTKRGKGGKASLPTEAPAVPAMSLKSTNYKLWLSQMKAVWLYNIERKKLCMAGVLDFDTAMAPRRNAGVSSFIAGRARNVMQQSWQIIEICETQTPGQLKLWVYLSDGSIDHLLLNMDRTLYMNFRKPKVIRDADGNSLPALNRRLPFRRPTLSLYEVTFSEEEFQKKSDSIRQALADPDVEGVYESKTPLVFRAVSEIGAVARYRSGSSRPQSQLAPIRLADVQMLNTVQCPYLQHSQPKCMYLHVISTEKQGVTRLMASLWAPMGDSKGYIVCMNNGISSKESAAMSTLYRQRVLRLPVELRVPTFAYPERIDFELKSVQAAQTLLENGAAVANFWKQVSNIIQNIISKKLGPMVLVHSTPFSSMQLKAHVSAASDLPVIPILYEDAVFAPFLNAPAKIIDRFLQAPWFYHNFISIARQLHVPVGNLQLCTQFGALDIYTTATDVLFSRLLRQHSYIWWASPSGVADFGGNETSLSACADIDLEHVEISRKGSYRSYCITLEIGQLAVAAILNFLELEDVSNLHEAAEAPSPIPYDGSTPAVDFLIDDTISSIDAFKVLNTMIRSWILQYNKEENVMSGKLLSSIYRWSVGNSSMFRSPILKQYLQRNMKKVLTELITHVQKEGGNVVFASFNKLIVQTKIHTISHAKQYCNYLIRSIHEDSRFKCLLVSPTSFWSWLLLLDGHNFGGYMIENAVGVGEDSSLSQAPRVLPGVASYWNLAEHLPLVYQPIFHELILKLIEAPYNERINRMEAGSILSLPGVGPLQSSQVQTTTDSPTSAHDLKTIISLVCNKFVCLCCCFKILMFSRFVLIPNTRVQVKLSWSKGFSS
jgi:DNA polymerase epsilon subunit 1